MRLLIDTNVVLDVILEREPFVDAAIALFGLIEAGRLQGYIAATTVTNIFYIVRKLQGREVALQAIARLMRGMALCEVNRQVIDRALSLGLKDFEDGVQLACAVSAGLDAVVTRNEEDFQGADFAVLSPVTLMARLSEDGG